VDGIVARRTGELDAWGFRRGVKRELRFAERRPSPSRPAAAGSQETLDIE